MGVVRLVQLDGTLPSLPLMRLSSFHKARGDEVVFSRSPYRLDLKQFQRWAARGLYRAVPWSEYDPGAKARNKPAPEQQAFDFGDDLSAAA
jgi:hypothetical protein